MYNYVNKYIRCKMRLKNSNFKLYFGTLFIMPV